MKWLKQITKEAHEPKFGIIDVLKNNLGSYDRNRSMDVVHASDTTKDHFCPRFWALNDMTGGKPQFEHISTALAATFRLGNLIGETVREEWLGQAAIGNWHCRRCNASRTMCQKPAIGCTKSSDCQWKYVEPNFVSQTYGVSGSIDVLTDLGAPTWVVTELKIMKVEDFDKLYTPLPEHRIRTSLYMKLISDSGSAYKHRINMHEARVLYVSRGFGKKNEAAKGEVLPFKEFVVPRDDMVIEAPLQKALQIKVFREKGLMPSGICNTMMDKRAKACKHAILCFSGNHPSQQEELI